MCKFKIFGEDIEQGALDQFSSACELDYTVKAALMPDAHQGYTIPIGAVVATDGVVLPSWVGYDIGCGMCAVPTDFPLDAIENSAFKIFEGIYQRVPVGFNHNERPCYAGTQFPDHTETLDKIFAKKAGLNQLGTLGGGNHFIEVGSDSKERVWIIIHSGSRGVGHGVATHYMRKASPTGKASEGHFGFRTDSPDGQDYIADLNFCLEFALANRLEIIRRVMAAIQHEVSGDAEWPLLINRNHNHAVERDGLWIHRKGATHAENGMMGVIPGNMRDGSFIVCGKGNEEALQSSSHGAGRVMRRKVAKQTLKMEAFEATMDGIMARVDKGTLDESPFAYKNIYEVMEAQKDLVDIVCHVKPILNVKG